MLELIIKAEDHIGEWMEATPWYARLLFQPEYRRAETALATLQSLRGLERDLAWYTRYAEAAHAFYDSVHDATDTGFDFYEQTQRIPVLGAYAQRRVDAAWQELAAAKLAPLTGPRNSYRFPTAPLVSGLVESTRRFTVEALANSAAQDLGGRAEDYRAHFTREYTPQSDGYWLRDAVLGVAEAVGSLLGYIIGEPTDETTAARG